jgi:hypothetical protein
MTETMQGRLAVAIARVDAALAAHGTRAVAPLSPKLLAQLRVELQSMSETVERRSFVPAYPRFLLDWPGDEEFVKEMIELAYEYDKGRAR